MASSVALVDRRSLLASAGIALVAGSSAVGQVESDDSGGDYTVEPISKTETKTAEYKIKCDPNSAPPDPRAFSNTQGVYLLNGMIGLAAYRFMGKLHQDVLTFERLHSIEGRSITGDSQTHVGYVYVGPTGITRFFFSETMVGTIAGEPVVPLYMSINGTDYFRVLTPTGTKLFS